MVIKDNENDQTKNTATAGQEKNDKEVTTLEDAVTKSLEGGADDTGDIKDDDTTTPGEGDLDDDDKGGKKGGDDQEDDTGDDDLQSLEGLQDEQLQQLELTDEQKTALGKGEKIKLTEEQNKKFKELTADSKTDDKEDLYKMPDGLSEKSRERFEKLVTANKEKDTAIINMGKRIGAFEHVVQQSGASPEEFAQLIQFSSLVKSGHPQNLKAALNMLDFYRERIGTLLGIEPPGTDLLKNHADLKQKVDNMEISREVAIELATSRERAKQQEQNQQNQQNQQQQAEQYQTAVNKAMGDLNAWEQEKRKTDLDYQLKRQILNNHITTIAKTTHPSRWLVEIEKLYQTITETISLNGGGTTRQTGKENQPLRPNANQNRGGKQEPNNIYDAVSLSLGKG